MVPNHKKKGDYFMNPCYPIEKQTLILKIVERDVFLTKPKAQYHLSRRGECIYGAKSWKGRRLFCESVFLKID